MAKEFVEYVILGHSERRLYFHETVNDVGGKMSEAVDVGLIPILCVDQPYEASQVLAFKDSDCKEMILAYGPVDAMTLRIPESPEKAAATARSLLQVASGWPVVYGVLLIPITSTIISSCQNWRDFLSVRRAWMWIRFLISVS